MRRELEAEDHQLRVLYELCSLIVHTLKFPPLPFPFPTSYRCSSPATASSTSSSLSRSRRQLWRTTLPTSQDSPAAFASLFLGISLSLILLGSVTFLVGLLLLPWVTLLVLVFYVAALVSNLSVLGRFVLGSITLQRELPHEANAYS
ncbi:hypothetical protein E2542_SST12912 [Spatholobus suberectus]|nr:hypothetical protein E2542_SST12912 [Spatholobus suberectus]